MNLLKGSQSQSALLANMHLTGTSNTTGQKSFVPSADEADLKTWGVSDNSHCCAFLPAHTKKNKRGAKVT